MTEKSEPSTTDCSAQYAKLRSFVKTAHPEMLAAFDEQQKAPEATVTPPEALQGSPEFEAFVRQNLGDIAVYDGNRYISPKIHNYWRTWQAATDRAQQTTDKEI
jgi:hypothetical protein